MIPFSPPRIDEFTLKAVEEVLKSGWITTGPQTKKFEKQLANYLNVEKVACFNSWTNAAELALRWYGVGAGDEVLVPAYTYAASANIICHLGATPVLVDSKLGSFNIDLSDLQKKLTSKTKAVITVDIGGNPVDNSSALNMMREADFATNNPNQECLGRPLLLSDGAHSIGAKIGSTHACHFADITGYSFHAVKNLTTAEGGALAFNLPDSFDTEAIYQWFMTMSLHGQTKDALAKSSSGSWRYDILDHGYKCNMTDLQAAIGLVELGRYESEMLPKRKAICDQYTAGFSEEEWAQLPTHLENSTSSNHLYMLRINGISEAQRDRIIADIQQAGVSVNVHFSPLPLFTAFKNRGFSIVDFPHAFESYSREISLPVYYDLKDDEVKKVIHSVKMAVRKNRV